MYFVIPGDALCCHNKEVGGGATDIQWLGTRDAAKHPTVNKNDEIEKLS